jgi:hypothetical protein
MANGGFFTRIGIGLALFALFTTFTITMLVTLGNQYGLDVETTYTDKYTTASNEVEGIALDSLALQEDADIEPDSFGTAQLRGGIGAEQKNIEYSAVVESSLEDIGEVVPYPADFKYAILTILAIMVAASMYYLLRGVWA